MTPKLLIEFVQDVYQTKDFIPLHAPSFTSKEEDYVLETIRSSFVSSVGQFVNQFEQRIEQYTSSPRAIATVNGTAALHTALYMSGIRQGDLVLTQALTFVATCNAIHQLGAAPIFIDVSPISLGICPNATRRFLEEHAEICHQGCRLKSTGQMIKALLPMHTFGHPCQIDELLLVCQEWQLTLIEDAAESLGSLYKGKHTGTFGRFGALSFNGNKIITTGGGGMVLCADTQDGEHTKHVTTTAKVPHPFEFYHDELGFNYRLPNINAALGCAQIERLDQLIEAKRKLAKQYAQLFSRSPYQFIVEPDYAHSNYWLNAILCPDVTARNTLLEETNSQGVMTRPIWQLMHTLPMYSDALRGDLSYSEHIEAHLVNIPSSPIL